MLFVGLGIRERTAVRAVPDRENIEDDERHEEDE